MKPILSALIISFSILSGTCMSIAQPRNSAVMTVEPVKGAPRSDEPIEVRVQIKNTGQEGLGVKRLKGEIDDRFKLMGATLQEPELSEEVLQKGLVRIFVFKISPSSFWSQHWLSHITTSKSELFVKVFAELESDIDQPVALEPANPVEITLTCRDSIWALVLGGFLGGGLLILFRTLLVWKRLEYGDSGNPADWPGWEKLSKQGLVGFLLAGVMAQCVLVLSAVSTKYADALGLQFTVHSFLGSMTVGLLMFTLLDKVEEILSVGKAGSKSETGKPDAHL